MLNFVNIFILIKSYHMKKIVGLAIIMIPTLGIFGQNTTTSKKDSAKTKDIEEVVIVGFGKQKKQNLTGSVSVVTEKSIEGRPVNNVVEALKGTAAGLSFNTGTGGGQLDNTASFDIRGGGTIGNTSSKALILIDGIEGDPSKLNPRDVASVSVLKDAAAASIYGSRGAFGVVIITTKSGKKGKTSITYDLMTKFTSPLLVPKMMDSESFAYYFNDAAKNAGMQPIFSNEIIDKIKKYKAGEITDATDWNSSEGNWNSYTNSWANTNWFKEFYTDMASSFEHNLSVAGGGEKSTYYFSANYLDQSGLQRHNPDHLNRYSVNGKIKADILPFLNLGYSTRFIRSDYNSSPYMNGFGGLFYHNIARRWPTVPIKDPTGHYMWGNEIPNLERSFNNNQQDILDQQLALIFTPIKNWVTNVELNYKIENFNTHTHYLPLYMYDQNGDKQPVGYGTGWGGAIDKPGGSYVNEYYWS